MFLQDDKGCFHQPEKKKGEKEKEKKKKKQKKKKCDPEPDDIPIPPDDIPIPPDDIPISLDDIPIPPDDIPIPPDNIPIPPDDIPILQDNNPMPAENNPIPPELQLPPVIHHSDPLNPIPQHSNRSSPIPPMPIKYEKTSIKELEEKDKQIKKSITALQNQLKDLMFEKTHIQSCLDYFETDQEDFMKTVETYHTPSTPPSSPPSLLRDRSPMAPPILPRPSFLQHMASSLLAVMPPDNAWSCSEHLYRMNYHSNNTGGRTELNYDPPLPESFSMFRCRSPPSISCLRPCSESPHGEKPQNNNQTSRSHNNQCYCWDCMHDSGYV